MLRTILGLSVLLLGALTASAQAQDKDDAISHYLPTPPVQYPGGVQSLRDVTYSEIPGYRPLTLDLYVPPKGGAPKPLIVFVHGGAWRHLTARDGGEFRDFPATLAGLAARGYVVASINYRFAREAPFPAPVQDMAAAIRWLRSHAGNYGIDPARVVAWGSSAGGQIATVIGTACGTPLLAAPADAKSSPPSACVQGVIDWYGLVDLEVPPVLPRLQKSQDDYLGCAIASCAPGLARSASPYSYIDAKDPPFLIQHGGADTTVSPDQSRKLYALLRAAHVPAELVVYPGVAHGFAKVPGGGPDDAVNAQALAKVVDWLGRYFPVTMR